MSLAIEAVLEKRSRQLAEHRARGPSLLASLGLHVVLVSGFVVAPLVSIQEPEPMEFVPVQIVPLQALGVESPAPAPAPEKPLVQPEPEAPVTTPEPRPAPTAVPEPKQRPAPERPAPTTTPPAESALRQREGSAFGSTLGTSAFGAAVGGLDNPDFVYGYYVDRMLAMISASWQRPPLGGEVTATIHFRIHRDGQISEVRVVRSSGYNSFDLAGLRAVQLAAPFPKLPQSFRHNSLGVNLILH